MRISTSLIITVNNNTCLLCFFFQRIDDTNSIWLHILSLFLGTVIENLCKSKSKYIDTIILSLRILHIHHHKHSSTYERILKYTSFIDKIDPELKSEIIKSKYNKQRELTIMCQIIKYNSQQFSIPKLSATHFLCLMANFSLMNHSCEPNVYLTYYIDPIEGFSVYATALRRINVGDELWYVQHAETSYSKMHFVSHNTFPFYLLSIIACHI